MVVCRSAGNTLFLEALRPSRDSVSLASALVSPVSGEVVDVDSERYTRIRFENSFERGEILRAAPRTLRTDVRARPVANLSRERLAIGPN